MSKRKKNKPRYQPLKPTLEICHQCGRKNVGPVTADASVCRRGYAASEASLLEYGCDGKISKLVRQRRAK